VGILLLLILTVVAFWPMNAALYYHGVGSPKDTITDAQSVAMARHWVALDWIRVFGAAAAFVAPLRALTSPWPGETARRDPLFVRILLGLALLERQLSWCGSYRTCDGVRGHGSRGNHDSAMPRSGGRMMMARSSFALPTRTIQLPKSAPFLRAPRTVPQRPVA
jgi:hypothetical protein